MHGLGPAVGHTLPTWCGCNLHIYIHVVKPAICRNHVPLHLASLRPLGLACKRQNTFLKNAGFKIKLPKVGLPCVAHANCQQPSELSSKPPSRIPWAHPEPAHNRDFLGVAATCHAPGPRLFPANRKPANPRHHTLQGPGGAAPAESTSQLLLIYTTRPTAIGWESKKPRPKAQRCLPPRLTHARFCPHEPCFPPATAIPQLTLGVRAVSYFVFGQRQPQAALPSQL
jgi:hypothetical protein